jgi:hypothetical protein
VGHDRLPGQRFELIPADECNARNAAWRRSCYRGPKANTRSQTLTCRFWRTQPIHFDDLLHHRAAFTYEQPAASRARRGGQFAMKAPFSHKGTGWTIARKFAVVPAGTRT